MLQDADPTGEAHVRLPGGGAVYFAERKEGYWDGPYMYLEGDHHMSHATLVISTKGDKVDIHTVDLDSLAEFHNGNEEEALKHFRVDSICSDLSQRQAKIEAWKNGVREACLEYRELMVELSKEQ